MPLGKLKFYWYFVIAVLTAWAIAMSHLKWWGMFAETWPMTLTMVFGSFIAGATAEGGGAVAFPVFTKLFGIASQDAKVFAFMIQSFGMTTAGLFIYLKRIPVLWNVVFLALPAGVAGLVAGDLFLVMPEPFPRIFFTFVAAIFGLFLVYNRWFCGRRPRHWLDIKQKRTLIVLLLTGFTGGLVSSVIGVGIDMVLFIVLTLTFGINEKISTPTTVVLMGLLSAAGFLWYGGVKSEIAPEVWQYWMSCVPVVILGAPLGAWFCSQIHRDQLIYLLIALITADLISTIWIIPMDMPEYRFILIVSLISIIGFILLLRVRGKFE